MNPIPDDEYDEDDLPRAFAYPYCYEPHHIAIAASDRLREKLPGSSHPNDSDRRSSIGHDDNGPVGKMMGVLVIRHDGDDGGGRRLGYLKVYDPGRCPPTPTFAARTSGSAPPSTTDPIATDSTGGGRRS